MFNPQMPPEDFLFLDQVLFCVFSGARTIHIKWTFVLITVYHFLYIMTPKLSPLCNLCIQILFNLPFYSCQLSRAK